ncbi:FusB/FusC family EF-G-binding protein [Paenibacillus sp. CGMCC 1.16610]|uniref:Elongation factor G-binding protein n=1 Tax=Paenibacillus anseongense TaxID=2682845 RepID=A0ABW9U9S7_9BACL|nr:MULTISPECIES: FusB/FusC family EF-G-binding protein [Paenibacillus]MBA2937665.1 FusB/FusC family EF-G-binding protein [Paenibacillus sp. CGMCC 1.16610]MVQ36723.1 elongation factor G-binding protein [Paenibacillus anseongense]
MCEPLIRNHQFNFIKKQAGILEHALKTNADPKVLESVRYSSESKIYELFPDATDNQKQMLETIFKLKAAEDFQKHLKALEPHLMEFPPISAKQILKLFPKNKKLKLPDLSAIDYRYVTYLSWIDIATNKLFIVYHLNGQFVGVEGKYTPTNKKGFCFLCNRYEELALFTAISKKRPAHTTPDYYKAVGNYLCMNGQECNKNLTDVASLEKFIDTVIG